MYVSSALKPSVGLIVLKIINVRFSIICVGLLCLYKCSSQRLSRPKRVPVLSRFGPMECLAQCLFRKECKYAHKSKLCHILEFVPHDPPPRKWDTCSATAFPRSILPKALAGACADHHCGDLDYCQPQTLGGYICVSVGHYSPCLVTSDCGDRNMECSRARYCLCKPGYAYNVTEDACSRTCSRSGPGFDGVYGFVIDDHSEFKKLTFTVCKAECERIGCKAVGWNGLGCSLHLMGYYEVPKQARLRNKKNMVLYVRHCW